jgi:hypothetical protein
MFLRMKFARLALLRYPIKTTGGAKGGFLGHRVRRRRCRASHLAGIATITASAEATLIGYPIFGADTDAPKLLVVAREP